MPQLDKITFLSQFFWLCFFYIGFYFLVLKFFLPKISLLLKLRRNKLNGSQDNVNLLIQENKKIHSNYETLFNNALITSKNTFASSLCLVEEWLQSSYSTINTQKPYISMNKTYVRCVGENKLKENLAFTLFTPEVENIYVSNLLETIKNTTVSPKNPVGNINNLPSKKKARKI